MAKPALTSLCSLPQLGKTESRRLWRQFFETEPPLTMRKNLMLRAVAHRMQEQEFGGLSESSQRRLRRLASTFETDPDATVSSRPSIKPGTRLVRQWKDQVHVVNVEENSYLYNNIRYQSLSKIARLITGTRWSGPLFFGLKETQLKKTKETRCTER